MHDFIEEGRGSVRNAIQGFFWRQSGREKAGPIGQLVTNLPPPYISLSMWVCTDACARVCFAKSQKWGGVGSQSPQKKTRTSRNWLRSMIRMGFAAWDTMARLPAEPWTGLFLRPKQIIAYRPPKVPILQTPTEVDKKIKKRSVAKLQTGMKIFLVIVVVPMEPEKTLPSMATSLLNPLRGPEMSVIGTLLWTQKTANRLVPGGVWKTAWLTLMGLGRLLQSRSV